MSESHSAIPADKRFSSDADRVTESQWNSYLSQFADASFYQTWAYGAVSWGERQLSHLVLRVDGRPVALAQLRVVRLPLIGRGVAYLRHGPVCIPAGRKFDEPIYSAMIQALVDEYVCKRRMLLRIIPRLSQNEDVCEKVLRILSGQGLQPEAGVQPYRTLRVDLAPPLETLRRQLDQKWRNQLNGAERNGLTVVEGTSDELYGEFLGLYDDLMARKQFETTVDAREFRCIQQRLPENQKLLILIARKDGMPMTGLVAGTTGDTGIYLLGAISSDGRRTKGAYLLQWHLIRHLKERGCRWYDLGGINPETNPGVYHFKQGLGGRDVCNLGRMCLSGDAMSTLSVKVGERLQKGLKKLKSLGRPTARLPLALRTNSASLPDTDQQERR